MDVGSAGSEARSEGTAPDNNGSLIISGEDLSPGESRSVSFDSSSNRPHMRTSESRESESVRVELTLFNRPELGGPSSRDSARLGEDVEPFVLAGRATAGGLITAVDSSGRQLCAYQATWTWDYMERTFCTLVGKDQKWWGPIYSFAWDVVVWEVYNAATWEYRVERYGVFKRWPNTLQLNISGVLRSNGRSHFWGWIS